MVTRIGPRKPIRLYLAERRKKAGLTQQQAADRLETTKSTISKWETRGRLGIISEDGRDITVSALAALAEAYNCSVGSFYHHPERPSVDALLANASEPKRREIFAVAETMLRTGTGE